MKPVLFVTGHAPAARVGAFAALHEREDVHFALFGGRMTHGVAAHEVSGPSHAEGREPAPGVARTLPGMGFPALRVTQRAVARLAASGRYRAVVASTGGRVALPAAWGGARAARIPLLLWTSLWAHPRSPAHAASLLALRRLYRHADAVVTYGPHVSAYVRARGARNVHVAVQAVDNDFWSAPAQAPDPPGWPAQTGVRFLFVGRDAGEKGLAVLRAAWRACNLDVSTASLVLVGVGPHTSGAPTMVSIGPQDAVQVRNFYAAADVLVVPSIATAVFREPWGLVVNEAMNQRTSIIASDAVGAAAGGLVRHEHNGLVVPASNVEALTAALRRLAGDSDLSRRLGAAGSVDVRAYSHEAWARGFSGALDSLGLSRSH